MSVIGIDFGSESCMVSTTISGDIKPITKDNFHALFEMPSYVAFDGDKLLFGVTAKKQRYRNIKNTIKHFKHMMREKSLGWADSMNGDLRLRHHMDHYVGIHVNYMGDKRIFTTEQITSMFFEKIKETCETTLQKSIKDCVITIPFDFSIDGRSALIESAQNAGLNVLHLLHDTTAAALFYGFYHDWPIKPEEKPTNIAFVDVGATQVQAAIYAYNLGELRMVNCKWREMDHKFDYSIYNEVIAPLRREYGFSTFDSLSLKIQLLTEIDKQKKRMSMHGSEITLDIGRLINRNNVIRRISHSELEKVCSSSIKEISKACEDCLKGSGLTSDEIDAIEIVGCNTRIPCVRTAIEKVFGKPVQTTLIDDEAISHGAALRCAMLLQPDAIPKIRLTELQNYPIVIHWNIELSNYSEIEVFKPTETIPTNRIVTIKHRLPFGVELFCIRPVEGDFFKDEDFATDGGYKDFIGHWTVEHIESLIIDEAQEVNINASVDSNGILQLVCLENNIEIKRKFKRTEPTIPGLELPEDNRVEETLRMMDEYKDAKEMLRQMDEKSINYEQTLEEISHPMKKENEFYERASGWVVTYRPYRRRVEREAKKKLGMGQPYKVPKSIMSNLKWLEKQEQKYRTKEEKEYLENQSKRGEASTSFNIDQLTVVDNDDDADCNLCGYPKKN